MANVVSFGQRESGWYQGRLHLLSFRNPEKVNLRLLHQPLTFLHLWIPHCGGDRIYIPAFGSWNEREKTHILVIQRQQSFAKAAGIQEPPRICNVTDSCSTARQRICNLAVTLETQRFVQVSSDNRNVDHTSGLTFCYTKEVCCLIDYDSIVNLRRTPFSFAEASKVYKSWDCTLTSVVP